MADKMRTHPSLRECMFNADENPAINAIKNVAFWCYANIPDFSILTGWKMLCLRIFGFGLALSLVSWLLLEGISIIGIIVRSIIMTIFFAIVYANLIAGMTYSFLYKWETFK